jgi:hypothetical protein
MAYLVRNVSKDLVTIRGNSGESCHLPPNTSITLPDSELSGNAVFEKLKRRQAISVVRQEAESNTSEGAGKSRTTRPAR